MYRHLDPEKVIETAVKLQTRVKERFPDSSLARLTAELVVVAQQSAERADEIARPLWGLRAGVGAFLVLMLSALGTIVYHLDVEWRLRDIGSLVQFVEAGTNEIVLMGAAVFFLLTFEQRYKRRRALKALHELRSLARTLTPFELSRYLEYCSEIWAVIGKVAAVYAQTFEDEAALTAVDEIEDLTTGLSNKVWQKLTILDAKAAKD